jgi:TolA-binding protein
MKTENSTELKGSLRNMQKEIKQLESKIQEMDFDNKNNCFQKFPFFTPFLKAVLLTLLVLLVINNV